MTLPLQRKRPTRQDSLVIEGRAVPVRLVVNARARRVILKVDPVRREVTLTSPSARRFTEALAFARQHADWIAQRLAALPEPVPFAPGAIIPVRGVAHVIIHETAPRGRVRCLPPGEEQEGPEGPQAGALPRLAVKGAQAHLARRVTDWLKREARADLTEASLRHAAAFGVRPARISLRDPASRWGSCSPARTLSYSWRLIFAPPFALDYVAAHEAAHLVEPNHGPRFWRLVESRIPDMERAMAWLKENGHALHRYGACAAPPAAAAPAAGPERRDGAG